MFGTSVLCQHGIIAQQRRECQSEYKMKWISSSTTKKKKKRPLMYPLLPPFDPGPHLRCQFWQAEVSDSPGWVEMLPKICLNCRVQQMPNRSAVTSDTCCLSNPAVWWHNQFLLFEWQAVKVWKRSKHCINLAQPIHMGPTASLSKSVHQGFVCPKWELFSLFSGYVR